MGILKSICGNFKKKVVDYKNITQKDIRNMDKEELEKYGDALPKGREIDMSKSTWGHSFYITEVVKDWLWHGYGFYTGYTTDLAFPCPVYCHAGDILLLKASSGRIGKYKTLYVENTRDPKDMFFAYIVCIGYVN